MVAIFSPRGPKKTGSRRRNVFIRGDEDFNGNLFSGDYQIKYFHSNPIPLAPTGELLLRAQLAALGFATKIVKIEVTTPMSSSNGAY